MDKKENITLKIETINKILCVNAGVINYSTEVLDNDMIEYKIKHIVDIFSDLISVAKAELKGYFTKKEALEIVSSFVSTTYTLNFSSARFVFDIVWDHLRFETPVACTTEESRVALLNKLNNLTDFQAYVVMCMAKEYLSSVVLMDYESERLKAIFSIGG